VLNVILWLALIISLPLFGFNTLYLIVAALGIVLMALVIALVLTLTRGNQRLVDLVDKIIGKSHSLTASSLRYTLASSELVNGSALSSEIGCF